MPQTKDIPTHPGTRHTLRFQVLAIAACLVLGALMILNTQMGGEGMWFWYATVFHHGAKLYSGLHIVLQPLYLLETNAWMTLFGVKSFAYETPSILHCLALAIGILLILRECTWPDWQKAIFLLGTFVIIIDGHSYRFDDYHVVAEEIILFALLFMLYLARALEPRRQLIDSAALGILSGLAVTTRLTDGAALLVATAIIIPFLTRGKKLPALAVYFIAAALTLLFIVSLTGDTFSAYLSNSLIHAAGSKGGTGSILAAPFAMFVNTIKLAYNLRRRMTFDITVLFVIGYLIQRFWKPAVPYITLIQLTLATLIFYRDPQGIQDGELIVLLVLYLTPLMYLLAPLVAARFAIARASHTPWDPREAIVLLPLAEWASYSAGAAAEPVTNYYAPVSLLLLLIPTIQPFRRLPIWVRYSIITVMAMAAFSGISSKYKTPYYWQNYRTTRMFERRVWYTHPTYGTLYIDSDLLNFSQMVCKDIGAVPGQPGPELLSIPYPYPNYFCNTPPWHNYVQTFFDTSPRATIERLMQELDTAPPQYIVYQRQLKIMKGSEHLYNHDRPWAQRDLDTMIMNKLATGQWQLLDKSLYISRPPVTNDPDAAWYIIRTHP
ncbi:hypothetical protein [Granulicella sibirica]|uniref:Permease of the drug/metabolite transporter (DMT) superfamily n=1 Tax=Granulicella sibirica TaxID=2479048 RepID=A0A4Q0SWV2_9BACT|nr:hypothetical protein [Granulicella sibirica]RXH55573.1 Permease of the drug/metabolite transporter (DMT) superfamily [Granulicella sibirica]